MVDPDLVDRAGSNDNNTPSKKALSILGLLTANRTEQQRQQAHNDMRSISQENGHVARISEREK